MGNEQGDGVMCLSCGDSIYSKHVHDFKYCSCKKVFVDGGYDYLRYGYENKELVKIVPKWEKE